MVGQDPGRGQLILVGGLTLAFIILSIVLILNGLLYTENLSASGTSDSTRHFETVEEEYRQGVDGIVREHVDFGIDVSLPAGLNTDLETYFDEHRNATANARPVYVHVSSLSTATTLGGGGAITEVTVDVTIEYESGEISGQRDMSFVVSG